MRGNGTMADEQRSRDAFRWQDQFCRRNDAPITAALCGALAEHLDRATATGRRILDWPGEPMADALPLRTAGGFHALYRSGRCPALAPIYRGEEGRGDRVWQALAAALAAHDAEIGRWLDGPPQTNEPRRSGMLMAGLLTLAERFGLPFELLEIGSSAGLNLLIDRYRYQLDGVLVGPADAPITIAPEWRGLPPPSVGVPIASVRGVDIAPIDVTDSAQAERLMAFIWPDQPDRLERARTAIEMVHTSPPRLEQGDAADWVEARLAEPQEQGTMRVLMHSVVWQYLSPASQQRIERAIADAGVRATPERPLGWVACEAERTLNRHVLTVRSWPGGGEPRRLGIMHPHGAWIEWGDPDR